jgi:hypothetical protein
MLTYTNSAGYVFKWPVGNPYIEVYHNNDSFPDLPLEVIDAAGLKREDSTLKRLGNELTEYSRW